MSVRLGVYWLCGAISAMLGSTGCASVQNPSTGASAQTPASAPMPPGSGEMSTVSASSPGTLAPAVGSTCAGLLSETPARAVDPASTASPGDTLRARNDTAAVSVGGAQTGEPDIILTAAVQANEVRFASQPRVRVRLCWGGDTLRVVQRENIPSPVVAGTTYRNVFVAVELLGRLNAECLVDRISSTRAPAARAAADTARGAGACAFLGAAATTGSQPSRPPPR